MVKTAKNRQKNKHIYVENVCSIIIFGNKVTSVNFSYRNSKRNSILVEIIQAKLILKRIIWSKRPKKHKKNIFA